MTLRTRLLSTVVSTALAFIVLVTTTMLVTRDVEDRQHKIQQQHIPRLELGPQLEADFAVLKRSYQDAVAAHDAEGLLRTNELRDRLLADLDRGRDVFDPTLSGEVRVAVGEYHQAALDVSRRMMSGLGDEDTVAAIAAMQQKLARAQELIHRVAMVDQNELKASFDDAYAAGHAGARSQLALMLACLVFVLALSLWNLRYVLDALAKLQQGVARFGEGRLDEQIALSGADELTAVAKEANRMAKSLADASAEREIRDWVRSGQMELGDELRGELDEGEVATRAARILARRTGAIAAAVYARESKTSPVLRLRGHHAMKPGIEKGDASPLVTIGEGLIGEAAEAPDFVVIKDAPSDFLRIRSGLGDASPTEIALIPLVLDGNVTGILELAGFTGLSAQAYELLGAARETIAIALAVAQSRARTAHLLEQTQHQAARLVEQEEELRTTNEELRCQQEELRQTNEELAAQRTALESRNTELQEVGRRLEQKAAELATVSAYKSQFLANMSHELRTPLNSMLLLSKLLEENADGNLTAKQVEYARTVHGAGRDLLNLINQVLDLAKVESGKQTVKIEAVLIGDVADHMRRTFDVLGKEKDLRFAVERAPGLPAEIATDRQRLGQILTNLIGNAIKFTAKGEVVLRIAPAGDRIAFEVRDTGPGIAPEHQRRVFEPFEQVDGSTQRRHGGTGLGLNIARELAQLLGGELVLESKPGVGSTFTCFLPAGAKPVVAAASQPSLSPSPSPSPSPVPSPPASDLHLLVIEDDPAFAEVLGDLIRDRGLVYATARDGATGLRLARERHPRGIILDVKLPDMDGWRVMEKLRANPETANIPVHFSSALEMSERGLAMGAVGYLLKPAEPSELARMIERLRKGNDLGQRKILVVQGGPDASLAKQLSALGVDTRVVPDTRAAFAALDEEAYACTVVDLDATHVKEPDLLEAFEAYANETKRAMPALIIYTSKPLGRSEAARLDRYAEAVVLKEGASTDRLLDEIRLFVRRLESGLPSRHTTPKVRTADVKLGGKKLLVVDDDMRTVYALSAMLRARGAEVLVAETGAVALSVLDENPDVHAVLMDVMMPEMDGYEATRRIRAQDRFRALPIIALTAKAMKGDEQRCLEAGATDYLAKPIDTPALLAVLQRRVIEGVH